MQLINFRAFIGDHRRRFENTHNNMFMLSLEKVAAKWDYLEVILARYHEASAAFVKNADAIRDAFSGTSGALNDEQLRLQEAGISLTVRVHLEIDSYYLFSKIMLDDIARAIEFYFGSARGKSLDSHDDLAKRLDAYAAAKNLQLPSAFAAKVVDLKQRISDFRDYEIAHEKSPRTIRATSWDAEGKVRRTATKIYPKESDTQASSEDIDALHLALQSYIDEFVALLEQNLDRTALKLDPSPRGRDA